MIALIDYRAGNLTSVRKGFAAVGAELFTPAAPAELARCRGIVVPGVGHFGATAFLDDVWRGAIRAAVAGGVPLLGICLGLQWLFEGSEEAPLPGLGALHGYCVRLPPLVKVPHVGWNSLAITRPSPLLDGVIEGTQVYFTHSYAAPVTADCVAATTHGTTFAAAVQRENVWGVQFHPEKSGRAGLRILENFTALVNEPRTMNLEPGTTNLEPRTPNP
jgi:imidazole glycerol-phosphate synthase subunit HisH